MAAAAPQTKENVLALLKANGVAFEVFEHDPVEGVEAQVRPVGRAVRPAAAAMRDACSEPPFKARCAALPLLMHRKACAPNAVAIALTYRIMQPKIPTTGRCSRTHGRQGHPKPVLAGASTSTGEQQAAD